VLSGRREAGAHPQQPERIVLDRDVTDLPLEGHPMQANQLWPNLAGCASVLLHAQAAASRLRLLKIGARIRITARRIWLSMASGFPLEAALRQAWAQLRR
jgi:hypothetical protein